MTKQTFLKELRRHLDRLPFEERENAIAYYEEYLAEVEDGQEHAAIAGLGSPEAVAAQIKMNYVEEAPVETPKQGFRKMWMVIVLIFAAPIAAPLAIALVAVIFSVFIAMGSLIFAIGLTAIVLIGSGILVAVVAFSVILTSPVSTLFFVGMGVLLVGVGLLFACLTYLVCIKLPVGFARLLGKVFRKHNRRGA